MYGLLGKSLKHSFSKQIHQSLGNNEYRLIETDDLVSFFKSTTIFGINVTIPYKEKVIPHLDRIDPSALKIGSVNTIVNEDGRLVGYNTDYDGLKALLSRHRLSLSEKKVLIIGNGAASKTVATLAEDLKARKITKICRHPRGENEIPFESIDRVTDYDIIVNTTPVGMYPNNDDPMLISLDRFKQLEAVVDLVYNPARTNLLLEAEEKGVAAIGGTYMLVMQAVRAHELFFKTKVPTSKIEDIYLKTRLEQSNIVLVGMPLSGKSKYALILSEKYEKRLVDTDESIEFLSRKKISEIFDSLGEEAFRIMESDFIDSIYKDLNLAISTGGGMIENATLMAKLRQNGIVIFLDKDPQKIASLTIRNRPLIKNGNDVLNLAKRRLPLYEKYSDIIIHIEKDTQTHTREIEEKLNEYLSR